MRNRTTILLLACLSLLSCSPRALREAQSVVAEADSLWHAGQTYSDSLRLSEAYRTLDKWQWIYPDEFAHSGYHYGRLLRTKDNPVEAMQCFIAATRSRTHDYHILGRVYSNMGTLCHLANAHSISYDMYKCSSEDFRRNGDSLSYYFGLYQMAFEMAILGKNDSVRSILQKIENADLQDSLLYCCCNLTKAKAFMVCQQYDSVAYFARKAWLFEPNDCASQLMLAQAYSHLEEKDSAAYYAQYVLTHSCDLNDKNNALYILTNDDLSKDIVHVRQAAADRADVQKLLEIRQGKMSQAIQLLEQDLTKKPDFRWLYAIIATIITISFIIGAYRQSQKKKHALLSQQVEDLANTYYDMQSEKATHIEKTCTMLRQSDHLQSDLQWQDYELLCDVVNKNFYMLAGKLKATKLLNEREIRMCILVLIGGFKGKQLAEWLYYAESGIRNLKNHTARKLGTNSTNLREFLIEMAIDGYVV